MKTSKLIWSLFGTLACPLLQADQITWTFSNPVNPLLAEDGLTAMDYFDPFSSNWGPVETSFDKASVFSLPLIDGADVDVMAFPGCDSDQGYSVTHGFAANGSYLGSGLVSNYTVIMDVLFPSSSDGTWRALVQTDASNSSDADFFVQNAASGGVGISANYRGAIKPDTWHRIVWVMRAAPGEGQAHRYIDGQFVGAIGTTGSGLEDRFALGSSVLLFADENNDTQPGFVSSLSILDRKLSYDEVVALGGPSAGGAESPGPLAGPYTDLMSRRVKTLGHRGSSGCAPENTLAAINQAFLDGAAGTEIDTRMTADGVVIAFHDGTVDRTTNGSGNVEVMTLAEIKALDAGSWFSPDFVGEKIPTLTEALNVAKGKGIIYLDIKTGGQAAGFATAVQESQFPLEDLWFWTPGNESYAAEIRAAIPGAQIVWGAPSASWISDPDYFSDLRALGVIGFSYGQGGADLGFSARAKEEGMFVEVFTVLDLEQYRAAAEAGVDYMETDFPNVMEAMQPAQGPEASGPQPAPGTTQVGSSPILVWIPALDATAHRVHFGTTNPPPFVREQSYDLFQTLSLLPDTTYYWQINEVTPSGTSTGPVWSFTTNPAPNPGIVHEWHLNGDLTAEAGDAVLSFAAGESTEGAVTFETSDGNLVPHMSSGPSDYLRIPAFVDSALGLDLSFVSTLANGGGAEINQYTFVFDILVPGTLGWLPFFNTDSANLNDSDFFGRAGGGLGIAALGYAPDGSLTAGEWHRVIFSADLGVGEVSYYIDGVRVLQRNGATLIDGRFSLSDSSDGEGPHVRLFNDENGETTEVLVGAIAFLDQAITENDAVNLGGPDANGILVESARTPRLDVDFDPAGQRIILNWEVRGSEQYTIESSLDLETWIPLATDISGTDGKAEYRQSILNPSRSPHSYYRVFKQ
ncbi:glycerophosphodiester phosphodiesterase family protein [Verrucomicrobiaceae bacterium 227]